MSWLGRAKHLGDSWLYFKTARERYRAKVGKNREQQIAQNIKEKVRYVDVNLDINLLATKQFLLKMCMF